MSNFGAKDSTFVADPEEFKTENNFDFDEYINSELERKGSALNKAWQKAKRTKETQKFVVEWRIGGRFRDFFTKSGSSLGRLETIIEGNISTGPNGEALVSGTAEFDKTGRYDWTPDGSSRLQNAMIRAAGSRWNTGPNPTGSAPGVGSVRYRDGHPVAVDIARDYYFTIIYP